VAGDGGPGAKTQVNPRKETRSMRTWQRLVLPLIGLVCCAGQSSALIWHPEAVDTLGAQGEYSSLALDTNSKPYIAYYDATNGDLKYATKPASKWQTSTVDAAGDVGRWCSLALDSLERPHISYYDATNQALRYAHWTGAAWAIETVEKHSGRDFGQHSSLALDGSDRPHISYYNATDSRLRYARWTGSSWAIMSVGTSDVGTYSSIAVDSNGVRHIAYYDIRDEELRHAWNTGSGWRDERVDSDGDVGQFASLALDNAKRPRISYYDATQGALKLATHDGSAWGIQTVDDAGDVGAGTSIDLDATNHVSIAYYDATNEDAKYARWTGAAWDIEPAETAGRVGANPSMKLGFATLPYISYQQTRTQDLRFATPAGPWLFFTSEAGYEDGVKPNQGAANTTYFRFHVTYQDPDGWGPVDPVVLVYQGTTRVKLLRLHPVATFPNYALGSILRSGTKLPAGEYTCRFRARGQSGLYAGGEPTEKRGLITVDGAAGAALASVSATPTTAGAQIALSLSSAAAVDATVLNLAGRPVKQLVRGHDCAQGTTTLAWTGQTDAGVAAPSGTYLIVVEARAEDGRQSRAIGRVRLQR
jgi:hypothetical protein